jgi:hypothetical protein
MRHEAPIFLRAMNRLARERDEPRVAADQSVRQLQRPPSLKRRGYPGAQRVSRRSRQRFRSGQGSRASRQRRQHELAWFCERKHRGIKGEGAAYEGQRGSRDHDKGFSDQGRTPGQFSPRSVAPASSVRGHHFAVAAGASARTRYPHTVRLRRLSVSGMLGRAQRNLRLSHGLRRSRHCSVNRT